MAPQFDCETFRKFAKEWDSRVSCENSEEPVKEGGLRRQRPVAGYSTVEEHTHGGHAQQPRTETQDPRSPSLTRSWSRAWSLGSQTKLRVKHQTAKLWYDKSARDLPELCIGQDIRMKPLPGDRTGRWRRGVCLQQVGPRSYLVDVEGTYYRRNRVDLRPAEVGATGCRPEQHGVQHSSPPIEQPSSPPRNAVDKVVDYDTNAQEVGPPRQSALHQPMGDPPPTLGHRTASGRLVKVLNRLNL